MLGPMNQSEGFPTSVAGLADARATEVVELSDGARVELRIVPVAKQLGNSTVRMLGYNGSIPGPTLKVPQGAEIIVDIENQGDLETTVHWHGLRLENRYDGTHETQPPIPVGGRFSVKATFPDPAPTGTTRTSARTTARRWACTGPSWSSPRTRGIGRRRTGTCSSRSMTSSWTR